VQDFVSTQWIRVVGLVASMAVVWAMSIPYGFPWMGFVWVSLAVTGALWLRQRSSRSIAQLIDHVGAEPVRVVAASGRVGVGGSMAGSRERRARSA